MNLCESILIASKYAGNPELFYPVRAHTKKRRGSLHPKTSVTLASLEKNKHKKCSYPGCNKPRYIPPIWDSARRNM